MSATADGPEPGKLTDRRFWETEYYWSELRGAVRPDEGFAFDRSLARVLTRRAPARAGDTVIEIGCAPAKWLVFYAERFGASVSGVEYSAMGAQLSEANLAACGVEGAIHEQDFFAMAPQEHDVVLSFGFLEHFDDLAGTFARHIEFVAPGGRLVLGVPNFRGVNRAVQRIADPGYLARHNTAAMSAPLLRSLGQAGGLELEHLDYLGGFDPSLLRLSRDLPLWHPRRLGPGAFAFAEARWRATAVADRVEHRWLSTYLLGVWRRPQ
ncbi:MAG TPA: methyltransferase domain-containing protein [Solirubrobacteraceae bacterium]|nr:methyltransferase domain-containing protein [Solirubrobacteraceae bacterium]